MGVTRPDLVHDRRTRSPNPISFAHQSLYVKIRQPCIWRPAQGLNLSARVIPQGVVVADKKHPAQGVAGAEVIVDLPDPVIGPNTAVQRREGRSWIGGVKSSAVGRQERLRPNRTVGLEVG